MISSWISRASAIAFAAGGFALLFGSDALLPRILPSFPVEAAWFGQIIAAAWLALGALNWFSRSHLLGGIYGRAVVSTNATYFFVTALSLLNVDGAWSTPGFWLLVGVHGMFAAIYCFLLFRGPLERDLREHGGQPR